MTTPSEDASHLRVLSVVYYVWAGLTLCFSCFGGIWMAVMLGVLSNAGQQTQPPPPFVAPLMGLIGTVWIVLAIVMAGLSFWVGKSIAERRNHTFCLVIAGLSCMSFPVGTALGVFTFIVLLRPSVKTLFARQPPAQP